MPQQTRRRDMGSVWRGAANPGGKPALWLALFGAEKRARKRAGLPPGLAAPRRLSLLRLIRQHGVALGRRIDRRQQLQPAAQMPARHLARSGLDVDIAADPVQVERESVLER